jgi:shikimate kinase
MEARPSLTGREVLQEVEELLAEREPLYREAAHLTLDTNRYGRAEIVSMIVEAYRRRQGEGVE